MVPLHWLKKTKIPDSRHGKLYFSEALKILGEEPILHVNTKNDFGLHGFIRSIRTPNPAFMFST